jgi:hypothetical protein
MVLQQIKKSIRRLFESIIGDYLAALANFGVSVLSLLSGLNEKSLFLGFSADKFAIKLC